MRTAGSQSGLAAHDSPNQERGAFLAEDDLTLQRGELALQLRNLDAVIGAVSRTTGADHRYSLLAPHCRGWAVRWKFMGF